MIKNYFKIAWRNLSRNKGFSITNVIGLTIGMTCTIFILLWVQDELSFDKFNKNYANIYQVMATRDFKNQIMTDPNMVLPLASALEKRYPQIKNAVVTTNPEPHIFNYNNQQIKKTGLTIGGNFFEMFSFKPVKGNIASVLNDPSSIALTESAAKTFFGKEEPLGKVLRIDNNSDLKVSAVLADPPGNSSIQFDFVKSFNFSDPYIKQLMNEWVNSSWKVYLQATPGTKPEVLSKIVNNVKKQHDQNDVMSTYFVFPMSKWRLHSEFKNGINVGGMIEYVRLFSIIAIIILLVACVNFMNLSTARSEKRAKEVGVRKTLGSGKMQLILQFYAESMILSLLAFVFSVAAVFLLLPSYNLLVGKQMSLEIWQPNFWMGAAAIILFTGIIAGSYPALYLSSFNPIRVLKGTFLPGKKALIPRRILVVSQFVISILLISATIVVYQQIQHVKNRNLGYNPNNLIMIPSSEDINKNYNVIRQELFNSGFISAMTRTFSPLTEVWWKSPSPDWPGKPANANIIFTGFTADVDFTKTVGIKMLMGKDFTGMPSDSSAIMLNKAAIDAMGIMDPIGMQLRYGKKTYTITGVIENIVMDSPFNPEEPMMIYYRPDQSNVVNIRLNDHIQPQKALGAISNVFKKYNPSIPFEYSFTDQEFEKKFITEELISKLTNIFAGLAIFICCLGLAGLTSFTIEKRFREIGIRKVVGATVAQILLLISKEFLRLVLLAFLIAIPLSWWVMSSWLQKYEYRVNISVWMYVFVGVAILLLTLGVVSLITIRTARVSPVKSLRTE